MVNNYPEFFKRLVVNKYNDRKIKISKLLDTYNISNGSLYNWINKVKCNESLIKKQYNKKSKYTGAIKCYIRSYVIRNHTFDYRKLLLLIQRKYNVTASKSSIYRILANMTITRKRVRRKLIYKKKNIIISRRKFKETIKLINGDDIISIDETSIDNQLCPIYGWSPKGKRIIINRNAVKERYTIITAISKEKIIHHNIIKGSADANHFRTFIMNLVNKGIENKHLLVDNARIHHAKIVNDYLSTTSNKFLYNVAYTPEFNPIEHMFSKVKNLLRKRAYKNKTELIKNIHTSFACVTTIELTNYYKYSLNK